MKRRTFPLSLILFLVALLAGPAAPARASHSHASSWHAAPAPRSPGPARSAPAPPPLSKASARATVSTHFLVLVPDFVDFSYPYWDAGFYWGWPYGYPPYGYGAWYGPPYPTMADEGYVEVSRIGDATALDLHISPRKAEVRLDGEPVGRARDYDDWSNRMNIIPGKHLLEMDAPGYRTLRLKLDVSKGQYYSLHYRLKKGKGLDPRSARDPAKMNPPGKPSSGEGDRS